MQNNRRDSIYLFFAGLLSLAPCLLVAYWFWPGIISDDASDQLSQAFGLYGFRSTHHPILLSLLMKLFKNEELKENYFLLFQVFMVWGCSYLSSFLIAHHFTKLSKNKLGFFVFFLTVFLIFLPPNGLYLVSVVKDTLYSYLIMIAFVFSICFLNGRQKKSYLVVISIVLGVVNLIRFNGYAVSITICSFLSLYCLIWQKGLSQKFKSLMLILMPLVFFFILGKVLEKTFVNDRSQVVLGFSLRDYVIRNDFFQSYAYGKMSTQEVLELESYIDLKKQKTSIHTSGPNSWEKLFLIRDDKIGYDAFINHAYAYLKSHPWIWFKVKRRYLVSFIHPIFLPDVMGLYPDFGEAKASEIYKDLNKRFHLDQKPEYENFQSAYVYLNGDDKKNMSFEVRQFIWSFSQTIYITMGLIIISLILWFKNNRMGLISALGPLCLIAIWIPLALIAASNGHRYLFPSKLIISVTVVSLLSTYLSSFKKHVKS